MKCICKGLYSINQESAQEQIRKIVQRNNCLYGSRLLKPSTPFTVQAILKVIFNGQWLTEKIKDNTESYINLSLCTRHIFWQPLRSCKCTFNTGNNIQLWIKVIYRTPAKLQQNLLIFDMVHLKSIRNN